MPHPRDLEQSGLVINAVDNIIRIEKSGVGWAGYSCARKGLARHRSGALGARTLALQTGRCPTIGGGRARSVLYICNPLSEAAHLFKQLRHILSRVRDKIVIRFRSPCQLNVCSTRHDEARATGVISAFNIRFPWPRSRSGALVSHALQLLIRQQVLGIHRSTPCDIIDAGSGP